MEANIPYKCIKWVCLGLTPISGVRSSLLITGDFGPHLVGKVRKIPSSKNNPILTIRGHGRFDEPNEFEEFEAQLHGRRCAKDADVTLVLKVWSWNKYHSTKISDKFVCMGISNIQTFMYP